MKMVCQLSILTSNSEWTAQVTLSSGVPWLGVQSLQELISIPGVALKMENSSCDFLIALSNRPFLSTRYIKLHQIY